MNRRLLAPFAVAFTLLASFAHAQPKPALVQDRDEPGRSPYQHELQVDCEGQIICQIELPAVPAGSRLVVTTVTASFSTSGASGAPVNCLLGGSAGFFLTFEIGGTGGIRSLTQAVTRYYEAGQSPAWLCSIGTGEFDGLQRGGLVGYLVAVP